MSVRDDLGPVLPCKAEVWAKAREIGELAERAKEFAGTGPTADLALALRQLDSMRAILGGCEGYGFEAFRGDAAVSKTAERGSSPCGPASYPSEARQGRPAARSGPSAARNSHEDKGADAPAQEPRN